MEPRFGLLHFTRKGRSLYVSEGQVIFPSLVAGVHLGKLRLPYLRLLLRVGTYQMVVSPRQTPVEHLKTQVSCCEEALWVVLG